MKIARSFVALCACAVLFCAPAFAQNILVKGSRFMKMEQIVAALLAEGKQDAA